MILCRRSKMKDLYNNDVSYDLVELDIEKAINRGKLIPKKVPIKQANGKVSYGIRWVNPNDESVNNKVPRTPKQNIDKPKSSVPHNGTHVLQDPKEDTGLEEVQETTPKEKTDRELSRAEILSQLDEDTLFDEPKREIKPTTENVAKDISNIHNVPGLSNYVSTFKKDVVDALGEDADIDYKLSKLHEHIQDHWGAVSNQVISDIENTEDGDAFVQGVQKAILKDKGMRDRSIFDTLGVHPGVLKHSLIYMLGEKEYSDLRSEMSGANLTINTYSSHLDEITKEGYVASTIESYIVKNAKPSEHEKWLGKMEEIYSSDGSTNEKIDMVDALGMTRNFFDAIVERASAEYESMRLDLEDRKPCYIAFNPSGSVEGGAPEYGDGAVVEVNPDLLKHCTVTDTDSFESPYTVPKVYSEDHLKDLYLLKAINDMGGNPKESDEDWVSNYRDNGDIPLEVQYHFPKINADDLSVYCEA